MTYLNKTGQSARGMLITFQRFQTSLALSGTKVDPYKISHPLPRERIANLEDLAQKSPNFGKTDSAALQARHDLARAKVAAYSGNINTVRRLFRNRPDSIGLKYGEAISTYLQGSSKEALNKFDALAKQMPQNGYVHEIRGEILLKSSRPADAAKAFRTALKLDPDDVFRTFSRQRTAFCHDAISGRCRANPKYSFTSSPMITPSSRRRSTSTLSNSVPPPRRTMSLKNSTGMMLA